MVPFRLFDLPDELIIAILDLITTFSDLRSLACTCRRVQAIVEPQIYRKIFIRTEAQAVALLGALDKAPWRAKAVISFEARCKYLKFSNVNRCSDVVRRLPSLQEYVIESPYCNNSLWRIPQCRRKWGFHHTQLMNVFQESSCTPQNHVEISQRPLQSLRKLILHLNGTDGREFWTFGCAESGIFAHPTLQELKISSVNLIEDTRQYIPAAHGTPLKSLCLEECNVTVEALTGILSHPAALNHLYIGEAVNCQDAIERAIPSTIKTKDAFFAALGQQKESLESLCFVTCADPDRSLVPTAASILDEHGLAGYTNLKTIDLSDSCTHLEKILTYQRTAPPNLETLFVRGYWYNKNNITLGSWSNLPDNDLDLSVNKIVASLPKLKDLHINLSSNFRVSTSEARGRVERMCREWVAGWKDRKVHLRVYTEPAHRSVVPPLLFGEVPQPDDLIFDSATGVFDCTAFDHDHWLTDSMSDDSDEEDSEFDDDDDDDDLNDEDEIDDDDVDDNEDESDEIDDGFGDVDADLNLRDSAGFDDARSWETVTDSD